MPIALAILIFTSYNCFSISNNIVSASEKPEDRPVGGRFSFFVAALDKIFGEKQVENYYLCRPFTNNGCGDLLVILK
jgi:hypothetical protein